MSTITYARNYTTNSPPTIDALRQTLNDTAITIDGISYATGSLRFVSWSWNKVYESFANTATNTSTTIIYYRRTYQLLLDPVRLHQDWVGSYGYRQKIGAICVSIDEKDQPGVRVSRPQPLDSAGRLATNGQAAKCVFNGYVKTAWAGLGIS